MANDSTSYPSVTGIEFIKNDHISIKKETLLLAKRSVNVEYEFYNHTSKEISVNMAFPLPEIYFENPWYGEPKTWNFLVFVNGKKYKNVRIQWRAIVGGVDKAKLLERLGIAVYHPSLHTEEYIDGCLNYDLKKEDQELLVSEGLIDEEDEVLKCFKPLWNAQAVYLWEARFAPRKITRVKHSYSQRPGFWPCGPDEQNEGGYDCLAGTDEFYKASSKFGGAPLMRFFYEYVIHTGGNWRGPIKKFKFIAQGPKGSLVWVKAPFPVTRRSDNTLTADLNNYKPLPKKEAEEHFRERSPEMDNSVIWFNYVKKNTPHVFDEIIH